MLYSIVIYGEEARVAAWTPEQEKEVMDGTQSCDGNS